jgi:hypothetical protein
VLPSSSGTLAAVGRLLLFSSPSESSREWARIVPDGLVAGHRQIALNGRSPPLAHRAQSTFGLIISNRQITLNDHYPPLASL